MSRARRAGLRPIAIDAERMRRITAAVEQLPGVDLDRAVATRRRNLAALGRSDAECWADWGIPLWLSEHDIAALFVAMATAQQEVRELRAEGMSRIVAARLLEIQIEVHEMLPPELRCDAAIAEMQTQLARVQRRHLSLVRAEGGDRNRGYRG